MKVKKLTADQNRSLEGLTLQEKLQKLIEWRVAGLATQEQLNYYSNFWITRESKKKFNTEPKISPKARTVVELEMNRLIDDLRQKLSAYIGERKLFEVKVSDEKKAEIRKYLNQYGYLPKINNLLILGLRYPDKELNHICAEYIKMHKLGLGSLWLDLWRDDLVPADAVRLMMDGDKISSEFSPSLVSRLLPLMKVQQEKEVIRLVWAESSDDGSTARKEARIAEFNKLIKAAEELTS
jgi:hypothetical protein